MRCARSFKQKCCIINKTKEDSTFEAELVRDMIELVTVFSARLYGSRSRKNQKIVDNNVKVGDRVVVPFTIACGGCFLCNRDLSSLCDNSNANAWIAEKLMGHSPSGLFGYSHMLGGYAGGQAEYARVPFADVGLLKVPDGLKDEQVLFLTDIFPTGYRVNYKNRTNPRS